MKKCFKCNKVKPLSDYYKHKQMGDGYLNKCKDCTKKDVRRRYYDPESRKKIIEYERKRFKDKRRKEKIKIYQKRMRTSNPGKYKSRLKISNAIRNGILKKQACEICGTEKVEAHHEDYRKPLTVRWLCRKHHLEQHNKKTF